MSKVLTRCKKHIIYLSDKKCSVYFVSDGKRLDVDKFLIRSVEFSFSDKTSIVESLKNKTWVFAFGHDPTNSSFSMRFTMFGADRTLKAFLNTYRRLRVSELKKEISIFAHGMTIKGIITGMRLDSVDEETDTYDGQLSGYILDIDGN